MTNTEILYAEHWRTRAKAYLKMKILDRNERNKALQAIDGITLPLYLARGTTLQGLKNLFIKKVVSAVSAVLKSDKYSTTIAMMTL